jgi:LEM3 (ligand-effect modulator 3) family / CDC50 family
VQTLKRPLTWRTNQVQELSIDYTNCHTDASVGGSPSDFSDIPSDKYSSLFKSSNVTSRPQWRRNQTIVTPPYGVEQDTSVCSLRFEIPNDIGPPVLLYYRLTNFYQNHRRYVKSLDTDQLLGKALDNNTIGGSACDPLKLNDTSNKAYYPCGLIANSLFNDTINTPLAITAPGRPDGLETYPMTNQGIAWSSDTELYKKTAYTRDQVEPPPNWRNRYPDGYTAENDIPDLSQYEEFQVWMRTAGLPTFSKLALRNDNLTMRAGTYQIDIYDCGLL